MTFIKSIKLSHFRSHKHANLNLDHRPIAISGANGSGKTNIIEAVSLFSPGRGLRRANAQSMMRAPECLGWKISGHIKSENRSVEISFSAKPGLKREVNIDGKSATQIELLQYTRVLWLIPSMDRLWIEGSEGRRRFLDRIALSFFPTHAENTLRYEKSMRERNKLLRDQVGDPHWYKAIENQMAISGASINKARKTAINYILKSQTGATTEFPLATLKLQQREESFPETEDELRESFQSSRANDLATGRTNLGPHKSDIHASYATKGIAANQCSTGEQKALLISIILANARALSVYQSQSPLLLLDEVSAHLDKDRRAALYEEISALGLQAWMTGTDEELFLEFSDRAQYITVSENNGTSKIIKKT